MASLVNTSDDGMENCGVLFHNPRFEKVAAVAWSAGQKLFLLLALLVGLAAGWLLRGRFPGGAADPQSVTLSDLPSPAAPSRRFRSTTLRRSSRARPPSRCGRRAAGRGRSGHGGSRPTPDGWNGTGRRHPAGAHRRPGAHPAGRAGLPATEPVEPVAAVEPVTPVEPVELTQPVEPELPAAPAQPEPVASVTPVETADSAPTDTIGQAVVPLDNAPVEEAPMATAPVEDLPVEQAPIAAAPIEDVPVAAAPVQATPVTTAADDNLRRIAGIGPKIEMALQAAGFRTYRQLAEATEPELRAAVRAANLRSCARPGQLGRAGSGAGRGRQPGGGRPAGDRLTKREPTRSGVVRRTAARAAAASGATASGTASSDTAVPGARATGPARRSSADNRDAPLPLAGGVQRGLRGPGSVRA